ncbi:hypothetical protein GGR32_001993 [Mesonia hippocampi]|uniref:Adhesin domain-containing protein n=1 Tax=Mesonia hippocampi TaxID=1628250 RepID=A0A840EXX8_9FLAO|nr:hypothetical protein [Mesonia hippocampi]MBB4119687.1 hypothetical protein [Mesonia hippocampi]
MKIIKHIAPLLLLLSFPLLFNAQNNVTTIKKSYTLKQNPVLNLNADRVNLVIETWNKDRIDIVGELTAEELSEDALTHIAEDLKILSEQEGNKVNLTINGSAFPMNIGEPSGVETAMFTDLPNDFIAPLLEDFINPMVEHLVESPPLPHNFNTHLNSIEFDEEAYKRDGEKYMKEYEKQLDKNLNKSFEEQIKVWSNLFESNAEQWSKNVEVQIEKNIEANAESFGKAMEAWGENFASNMEAWASQFEANVQGGEYSKTVTTGPNGSKSVRIVYKKSDNGTQKPVLAENLTHTIYIKMPKEGQLNLTIRHGKVDIKQPIHNMDATVSYAAFYAKEISGKETNIDIAHSPVQIDLWNSGNLNLRYTQNTKINTVKAINLHAKTSNVYIKTLEGNGSLDGSFGALHIDKLSEKFETLAINLKNSELSLKLPDTAFHFNYNGTSSGVVYPKTMQAKVLNNNRNTLVNGFNKTRNTNSSISINADYSDIYMN